MKKPKKQERISCNFETKIKKPKETINANPNSPHLEYCSL